MTRASLPPRGAPIRLSLRAGSALTKPDIARETRGRCRDNVRHLIICHSFELRHSDFVILSHLLDNVIAELRAPDLSRTFH